MRRREINHETIGSRIRELRLKNGVSQEQLALYLNFENKGTISSYETDRRTVPTEVVIRIAEFFQTTTDFILCGKLSETDILQLEPELAESVNILLSLTSSAARKTALEQIRALASMEQAMLR
ncbi:MAG: helix-turn-helix domain-containing protein [Chordicoccus sp.]